MKWLTRKKPGNTLLYIILCAELGFSMYSFLLSPQGMRRMHQLRNEQAQMHNAIQLVNSDIKQLEENIHQWKTYTYYREKEAREKLQMARRDEIVYYL